MLSCLGSDPPFAKCRDCLLSGTVHYVMEPTPDNRKTTPDVMETTPDNMEINRLACSVGHKLNSDPPGFAELLSPHAPVPHWRHCQNSVVCRSLHWPPLHHSGSYAAAWGSCKIHPGLQWVLPDHSE